MGKPGQGYSFTANVRPVTTTTPITFTWQASGQDGVVTSTEALSHSVTYTWHTSGTKTITVTARNNTGSAVSFAHTLDIVLFYVYLPWVLKSP